MTAAGSLIPELEEVIQHGSPERRIYTLKRIAALFLEGARRLSEDHVRIFDNVFMRLIEEIETKARAELAGCLAPIENAPVQVVTVLAKDDDISVAAAGGSRFGSDRRDQGPRAFAGYLGPRWHCRTGDGCAGTTRRP
jgi:uncharacterized protein (DUF2336 family)